MGGYPLPAPLANPRLECQNYTSLSLHACLYTLVCTRLCLYVSVLTYLPLRSVSNFCLYLSVSTSLSVQACLYVSVVQAWLYKPVSTSLWLRPCLYVSVSMSLFLPLPHIMKTTRPTWRMVRYIWHRGGHSGRLSFVIFNTNNWAIKAQTECDLDPTSEKEKEKEKQLRFIVKWSWWGTDEDREGADWGAAMVDSWGKRMRSGSGAA